jgi:PAS domain S-box-containing protein
MATNVRILRSFSSIFHTQAIRKVFLIAVGIGIVFSSLISWYLYQHNQNVVQSYIESLSVDTEELVKKRFEHYEYGLEGAKGLIFGAGIEHLNRTIFARYVDSRNLSNEFPGARGFGFIKRVPLAIENQFIQQAKADNAIDFSIKTLTPHYNDRFIIQYIYPKNNNEGATGLDIASEKNRRSAALKAAKEGKAKLTAPLTLVQAEGKKRHGFLVLLPIYDPVLPTKTPENRIDALLGWTFAPLVVDEVLADLGMLKKGVKLTLTDEVESVPFYENIKSVNSDFIYTASTERTIQFMGRKWILNTYSLTTIPAILGLWSPIWVGLLCLVLSTLLCFIIWAGFINNKSEYQIKSDVDIRSFLNSSAIKKLLLAYLSLIIIFLIIIAFLRFPEQIQGKSEKLVNLAQRSQAILVRNSQEHKEDLLFLASTPPITGLINAIKNQENGIDSPLLTDWKIRLIEIFKAYIISSPNVYQVRLIQYTRNGYEIVRVERRDDGIFVVPDSALQFKGDRPYIKKAVELSNGEVWLSDIELNKENNTLELPYRPTYRYLSPVFDQQKELFGVVVINIDAKPLLDDLKKLSSPGEALYVTNSKDDFIIHPQATKLFGTDIGTSYQWEQEFTASSLPFQLDHINTSTWKGPQGDMLVAEHEFTPNNQQDIGKIRFKAASLVSDLYRKNIIILINYLAILVFIGLLAIVFIYFNWAQLQRARIGLQELAQRKKDKMFESLIELSPEALIICDTEGNIEIINTQTEKLFKYHRADMLGRHINIFIPNLDTQLNDNILVNNIHNTTIQPLADGLEMHGLNFEGNKFPVEISISPVQVEDKLLFAASIRDISERMRIEDTLRAASYEAERANKAKSSFLANMSHEIRTPLNAVIGLTYLLRDEKLTKEQMDLVIKVQLSGRSLLGIVNDVLDLAKIEANEVNIILAPCKIKILLRELISVFSSQAESKGLELSVEISPDVPRWIMTDDKLMRQMLTNLLGNAIKFTKQGHILLKVSCDEPKISHLNKVKVVIFEVSDTGIGISPDAQRKLFQPFSQVDESANRQFGGTGLGLSIVSNMIELLGGEVKLKSVPNQGSSFSLYLPVVEPSEEELEAHDTQDVTLNVLIAEDDINQQLKLVNDCKALGWRVTAVSNGSELIAKIKEYFDSGQPLPDVLLVDWQMPELDGLQALSLLTEEIGITNLPAVLVISAFEKKRIAELDSKNLIDSILHKPVNIPQLFNAVNDVVVKHTGNSERVFKSTKTEKIKAQWLLDVNILVVDDSDINLEVVGSILERNGAIANKVSSGAAAIEYLKSTDSIDVVLMDIQMPEMDGMETTQHIRNELQLHSLPIIALTAGTLMEERRKSLAAGMNDFLTKPIEPTNLIRSIRKLVEAYRSRTVKLQSINTEVTYDTDNWPIIKDLVHDKSLLDGDLPFFISIIERIFSEHEDLLLLSNSTIHKIITEEDKITLANKIHKLRGSLGLIGAQKLFKTAGEAEISLRSSNENTLVLLKDFRQEFIELRDNCQALLLQHQVENVSSDNPASEDIAPMDPIEIKELELMLKSNDIAALQFLSNHTQELKTLLINDDFEIFHDYINNLKFKDALTLLQSTIRNQ